MRKIRNHETRDRAEVVFEPMPTRPMTGFIEIESEPIRIGNPFVLFPTFAKSAAGLTRSFCISIWPAALFLFVALAACELCLRAIEPRLVGRVYSTTLTGGYPIAMNQQGFRGKSIPISKAPGVLRVLALGDSVTFGVGIAAENAWPAQLQEQMQAEHRTVEVINTGLPYLDIEQIQLELEERWLAYAPDQAVIVITGNMLSFGYASREWNEDVVQNPLDRVRAVEEGEAGFIEDVQTVYLSFALPSLFAICMDQLKFAIGLESHAVNPEFPIGVMLAHGYRQSDLDSAIIAEAWSLFENQLGSLIAKAEQLGIPIAVAYAPPRFMLSDHWRDNLKSVNRKRLTINPIERTATICRRLGVPFIDPRTALAKVEESVYVLADYTHFDVNGHRVLATLIAHTLNQL